MDKEIKFTVFAKVAQTARYIFDILLTLTSWVAVAISTSYIVYEIHERYPKQVYFSLILVISWLVGDKFLQWVWIKTKSGKSYP